MGESGPTETSGSYTAPQPGEKKRITETEMHCEDGQNVRVAVAVAVPNIIRTETDARSDGGASRASNASVVRRLALAHTVAKRKKQAADAEAKAANAAVVEAEVERQLSEVRSACGSQIGSQRSGQPDRAACGSGGPPLELPPQ